MSRAATRGGYLQRDAHEVALLEQGMCGLFDAGRNFVGGARRRIAVIESVVEFLRTNPRGIGRLAAGQRGLRQSKRDIADVTSVTPLVGGSASGFSY